MKAYESFVNRKRIEYGEKFDASDLAAQFIPAYESDQRISVAFVGQNGEVYEVRRGRVGVTTGWRPCFILLHDSRAISSSYTLSAKDHIVTMQEWREYRNSQAA